MSCKISPIDCATHLLAATGKISNARPLHRIHSVLTLKFCCARVDQCLWYQQVCCLLFCVHIVLSSLFTGDCVYIVAAYYAHLVAFRARYHSRTDEAGGYESSSSGSTAASDAAFLPVVKNKISNVMYFM